MLLASLCACQKQDPAKGPNNQPSLQGEVKRDILHRVQVAPVERKEMVRTLTVTRAIESEFQIEVLPQTTGTVVELLVDEGDAVVEGQVLARLDGRQADAALRDSRLALEEARGKGPQLSLAVREAEERVQRAALTHQQANRDYERNKSAGFVSSSDLEKLELSRDQAYRDWQASILSQDSAKQDLENQGSVIDRAELAVEKAELELSYYEIKAPFPGIIAERKVNLGASVGPNAGAFLLTDPAHLRAVLFRPQKELEFFQKAAALQESADKTLAIRAVPEAYGDVAYGGTIRRVSPTVDAQSGSIRVTIDLQQPPAGDPRPPLLPGMMVRLSIVTERHEQALVVQKRALRREGERRYLFVVREGRAVRVEVEEGLLGELDVEVIPVDGYELREAEPVVIVGGRDLEDGQDVQLAPPTPTGDEDATLPDGETSEAQPAATDTQATSEGKAQDA